MVFIGNYTSFSAVKKIWKSIKNWRSWRQWFSRSVFYGTTCK